MPDIIHGYAHGDRVRDRRDGSTGTVRVEQLSPVDARDCGRDIDGSIRWDSLSHASQLDLDQAGYLERI